VSVLPDHLERRADVDLHGRNVEPWIRRAFLILLAALSALGLANVFGQHPDSTTARSPAADLTLSAPSAMRGGLIYEVRVTVRTHRALRQAELAFAPGWYEGFTVNTFQPDPVEWEQRAGRNVMLYGPLGAGEELVVRLQYQTNPTALGRRDQDVSLADHGVELVTVGHDATVYP
jgi:hypothetical protein